jgi:hypothetical protein
VDIRKVITYYPLKMADGLFHIFMRTEIISSKIEIEDVGVETFDDYNSAYEKVNDLNNWRENGYLSDIQDA